jgi:hypothetical protein
MTKHMDKYISESLCFLPVPHILLLVQILTGLHSCRMQVQFSSLYHRPVENN